MKKYTARDIIEFGGFVIAGFFVRLLPFRVAQRLGRRLGQFLYTNLKIRREVTYKNLKAAFPDKSIEELDEIALEAYCNLLITYIELFWFPNLNRGAILHIIRVRNPEVMENAWRRKKGLILLSGHFGSWELMVFSTAVLFDIPFTIIAKEQRNPLVDKLINKYRSLSGNRLVSMDKSVRQVLTTLRDGGAVAMLADQSAPRERLYIDFFGRPAATYEGPAVFALRSGAPIVMFFLIRQKSGRYELVFEELSVEDLDGQTDENVIELTRRHVAVLERYIREYPGQWLWLHKRWKHTDYARQQSDQYEDSLAGKGHAT